MTFAVVYGTIFEKMKGDVLWKTTLYKPLMFKVYTPMKRSITSTRTPMHTDMSTGTPMSTTLRRRQSRYMVTHNRHHVEELHELAHSVEGEAAQLLHEAVVDLTVGNEKLAESLRILKGEE